MSKKGLSTVVLQVVCAEEKVQIILLIHALKNVIAQLISWTSSHKGALPFTIHSKHDLR